MKRLLLITTTSLLIFTSTWANMQVCYGSLNSCFTSNGTCNQLQDPCSENATDNPWLNGCLCFNFGPEPIVTIVPDEYDHDWTFRAIGSYFQIQAANSNWITLYDMGAFDSDEAIQFHFVDDLDIVVINVYKVQSIEEFYANSETDLSSILDDSFNISFDDEAYE